MKTRRKSLFTRSNWNLLVELVRAQFKLIDHNSILVFLGGLWQCSRLPTRSFRLASARISAPTRSTCFSGSIQSIFFANTTGQVMLSFLWGRFSISLFLLAIPVLIAFLAFLLGVTSVLTVLNCFARDVGHLWVLFSRVLFCHACYL